MKLSTIASTLFVALLLCAPLQLMASTTETEDAVDVPHRPSITFAFPTFLELDDVLESAAKDMRHRKALRTREGFRRR